jgi:hypothetical protein
MNFQNSKKAANQSTFQTGTQANKSTDDSNTVKHHEEYEKPIRKIEQQYGKEVLVRLLSNDEISLYEEYLEPSETRFSKTNIFTNYKEFHNRRNIEEIDRKKDKKYFTKQMRIVNKDKNIDKRMPCWASDVDLIRKVQVIQNKLIKANVINDNLLFAKEDFKRAFLEPKMK